MLLYMNDYYYYTIICPFIKDTDRVICKRDERRFIALKSKRKRLINAFIYLHQGSPCGRYCICGYFDTPSVLEIYNTEYGLEPL